MIHEILWLILLIVKIVGVLIALTITVAYLTFFERKVIGYMQARLGPNRVGIKGWGQPIADVIKLLFKEIIIPKKSNRFLFLIAPMLVIVPTLTIWAIIPVSSKAVLANINLGILFILTFSSITVFGIMLAGWASNSKYALLGAMREVAQLIAYEIAMGFAVVGVVMASGSLNLQTIVMHQSGGIWHWYFLPLFPLFIVFWIAGIAETNRLPFDVAEGESELVAGFHVEYSGIAFGLFFLAEYINMLLISVLAALFFFGGWLSPVQNIPWLSSTLGWVPGSIWLFLKIAFFMYCFFWLRATLPRFRYDQIMGFGWKILIPITLFWIVILGVIINLGWL
ncbi:MAG: NADH-quinone oxidoreductase subunit NuoH [Gammaproteobacteria bacterium]|nr:NADH-quinone oxidoreductase subunit NuoH [Gammaproteobacteria bacterium]